MSLIDIQSVTKKFAVMADAYQNAEPFPHMSVNGLFDEDTLREINKEFLIPQRMSGAFGGEIEGGKFTESNLDKMGPVTREFLAECLQTPFLNALSIITGIDNLIPDPSLLGGGLHQTVRGGRLKVHSDFNVSVDHTLVRKLNLLIYLNEGWQPEWGGALELWDKDMTAAQVVVPPVLGQAAMFTCSDISFHGLPDPIDCPQDVTRRSLALYYYTKEDSVPVPRSTMWKERPGERFL
jgi:Rps23 Pro-64 3,4-dihydroxylase Tpa1-like proline 4-hydroxylase